LLALDLNGGISLAFRPGAGLDVYSGPHAPLSFRAGNYDHAEQ
jgi:hypothetical protein